MTGFSPEAFARMEAERAAAYREQDYVRASVVAGEMAAYAPEGSIWHGSALRNDAAAHERLGRYEYGAQLADRAYRIHTGNRLSSSGGGFDAVREQAMSAAYVAGYGVRLAMFTDADVERIARRSISAAEVAEGNFRIMDEADKYPDQYSINGMPRISIAHSILGKRGHGYRLATHACALAMQTELTGSPTGNPDLSDKERTAASWRAGRRALAVVAIASISLVSPEPRTHKPSLRKLVDKTL
jgi:hypothetical protein